MTIHSLSLDEIPDLNLTGAELRFALENSKHLETELAGHFRWSDGTGPYVVNAIQPSVERALLAELFGSHTDVFRGMEGPLGEEEAQVQVFRDEEGTLSYIVNLGHHGDGTHCYVKDLANLTDWFDEDWIEDDE